MTATQLSVEQLARYVTKLEIRTQRAEEAVTKAEAKARRLGFAASAASFYMQKVSKFIDEIKPELDKWREDEKEREQSNSGEHADEHGSGPDPISGQ